MSQQSQLFDQSDVSSKDSFLLSSEDDFKIKNIKLMPMNPEEPLDDQPPSHDNNNHPITTLTSSRQQVLH